MISNNAASTVYRSSSIYNTDSSSLLETQSSRDSILEKSKQSSEKSSFSSANSEDLAKAKESKICYICNKGFMLKRKFICKKCLNAVCSDHSKEKTAGEKTYRVCDQCDNEATKKEIKLEIEDEISKMSEELQTAKAANERLNREYFDKTAAVNMLEMEIEGAEIEHKEKIELTQKLLKEQQWKKNTLTSELEKLRKAVQSSKEAEKNLSEKCTKSEADLEELRAQTITIHTTTEEMKNEIEKINLRIRNSMNLEEVNKLLCARCKDKVNVAYQNRVDDPSLDDPTQSTLSLPEKRSIIDDVRDMRNSLENGQTPKKCLLM